MLLYRILGNDLPPRHDSGSTLRNARFILEHEVLPTDVERRWLLNRIVDRAIARDISALISAHGERVVTIEFDREEYASKFLDPSGLPAGIDPLAILRLSDLTTQECFSLEWLYRHKIISALNLNRARNTAIADGRREAQWTFVLDGNTFMAKSALNELQALAGRNPDAKYLVVPMQRLANNDDALDPDFEPKAFEEPQVAFREDARDLFDETLRYNIMDKAELLNRLDVPGMWQTWSNAPWEPAPSLTAFDAGAFVIGSWVARLASTAEAAPRRIRRGLWVARLLGCVRLIDNLDRDLARSAGTVRKSSFWIHAVSQSRHNQSQMIESANSIVASAVVADEYENMGRLTKNALVFSIAHKYAADADLARSAAQGLRAFFVNPRMLFGPEGVVDFRYFWPLLDVAALLAGYGDLSFRDVKRLRKYLAALSDQLSGELPLSKIHVATCDDLAMASIAAFIGDTARFSTIIQQAPARLHQQVQPYGAQLAEMAGPAPLRNSILNLKAWVGLAHLGRAARVDLWKAAGSEHRNIPWAIRFAMVNRRTYSDYAESPDYFDQQLRGLLQWVPADAAEAGVLADLPKALDGDAPPWWLWLD